jgi:hypothetical protein
MTVTLDQFDPTTLQSLLDERAALLDASLLDRTYEEDLERKLASELIAALTTAQRHDALEWLLTDKMHTEIAMDGLLDECEMGSYEVADAAARMILAVITAQDREAIALEVLVRDEICKIASLIAFARERKAQGAA